MLGSASTDSRSFHRICLIFSLAVSCIFAARYGWKLYSGVPDTVFAQDFTVFYKAATLFVTSPSASPYSILAFSENDSGNNNYHPFLNPPFLLYLLWPLGFLPYWGALAVFLTAQIGLWLAVLNSARVRHMWKGLSGQPGGYFISVVTLSLPFLTNCILSGQLGIFYSSIILLGTSLLATKPFRAGCILGVILCKPTLGLLVPVLLLFGNFRRALAGYIITAMLLVISASMLWGISIWWDLQQVLGLHMEMMKLPQLPLKFMVQLISPYAGLRVIGVEAQLGLLLQLAISIAIIVTVAVLALKNRYDTRLYPLIYVGCFAVTAYALQYDAVLLGAAIAYLLSLNASRLLALSTRIGILLSLSSSIVTIQLQAYHIPFGAISLLWLLKSVYSQKPIF